MALYGSMRQGGDVVCGCACGDHRYGKRFKLDISGAESCGCVAIAAFPGRYSSIEITSGMVTEFDLEYLGDGQWSSDLISGVVYDEYFLGTSPDCDPPTTGNAGNMIAHANCIYGRAPEDPFFQYNGKLLVDVLLGSGSGTYAIYAGAFEIRDSSQESVLECGMIQPVEGTPLAALYSGGNGSISAHEYD